mgnify:CR=1 FL=1
MEYWRFTSWRIPPSLEMLKNGVYRYELKRPWSDGTQAFLFEPLELMEKLAALVPIPRANLVRYHGVLAPASKWRAAVVPSPDEEERPGHCSSQPAPVPADRVPWAWLLRRVFLIEVLRCARSRGTPRAAGKPVARRWSPSRPDSGNRLATARSRGNRRRSPRQGRLCGTPET